MAISARERRRARQNLDQRAAGLEAVRARPARGWVRAVREALGMSATELAGRCGLTHQRISQIERAEVDGTLKLETLERIAAALDCTLVYGLVPNTSLEATVRTRAQAKARARASGVAHSMRLEDQAVAGDITEQQLEELASALVDRPRLWSE